MIDAVEKIYEAAFRPELWPEVLELVAQEAGAKSGALLIIDSRLPPLFAATSNVIETLERFSTTPQWYDNLLAQRLSSSGHAGFLERSQYMSIEERSAPSPYNANLEQVGADWQMGTAINMPDGEMVVLTFEREVGLPNFDRTGLQNLDRLRPHFARSSLLSARLKLERSQASVQTMAAIGIPAAVVGFSGAVIATNELFEALDGTLFSAAFGRLAAKNRETNRLLQLALAGLAGQMTIRSFPMAMHDDTLAVVIHVIPLHRSASEIFDQGSALVAVTGYSADGNIASDVVLRGLFDLSAAEVRVALRLQAGQSVADVAAGLNIAVSTVRTHLAQIFQKTGTTQQGQLIALLKGNSGRL